MFFKSGVTTPTSVAILSIATAGILSTNDYSTIAQHNKIDSQIQNLKTLTSALSKRLSHDGKIVQQHYDSLTEPDKKDGSIWSIGSNPSTCDESGCSDWSQSALGDGGGPSKEANFNTEHIRQLTTGFDAECSYYGAQNGSWQPWKDEDAEVYSAKTLLPCNLYRMQAKGPLGNSTATDILTVNFEYGDDPDSPGIIDDKQRVITSLDFKLPLHNIVTASNYGSVGPYFLSKVKDLFEDSPYIPTIMKGSDEHALNPILFLTDECSVVDACQLKLYHDPKLAPSTGNGGGGDGDCTDCLQVDGTNSMASSITFATVSDATPILVWKKTGVLIADENIDNASDVASGIVVNNTIDELEIRVNDIDTASNKLVIGNNKFDLYLANLSPLKVTSTTLDIAANTNITGVTTITGDTNITGGVDITGHLTTDGITVDSPSPNTPPTINFSSYPTDSGTVARLAIKNKDNFLTVTDSSGFEVPGVIKIHSNDPSEFVGDKTVEIDPSAKLLAQNDNWTPYPGDDEWLLWNQDKKLEWASQVPNVYTVTKLINNILAPYIK